MTETVHTDAIVIGSGFGGAVAAARLAQAGFSVVILERGRRWAPGTFPRAPRPDDGWLWQADQGLYDIRSLGRMFAVQAAGWGGGSLAYANVFARPFDRALDNRWPAWLRRDLLDPYFDLAAHMLGISPVGKDPASGRVPPRTALIEQMMRTMDRAGTTVRPNLAVTFGDPETWRPNRHGVPQRGCAFVGECVLGCNHGAKNSLDRNYLAVAEQAGARAVTDAEVVRINPRQGGYTVTTTAPSDPTTPHRQWAAPRVVLAAGAVASTELLLRARDLHRSLPELSSALGHGFSGNGDFLTLVDLDPSDGDMTTGPTITTSTVLDVPEGRSSVWYQVQDGAFPAALHELFDALVPGQSLRRWFRRRAGEPNLRRAFAVLGMGHDSGNGRLALDRSGSLALSWRNTWQSPLYRSQRRIGPLLGGLLNARPYNPLTWSLLRRTTTVHPLGGVRADNSRSGAVVDDIGEVHGYPGLFVMDGSVLPASTGVNPSATILAVAERSIETVIRRSGQPGWRAPEWPAVTPAPAPEDAAFWYSADLHASTRGGGVTFHERMRSAPGSAASVDLTLDASLASIELFVADPAHRITVRGILDVEDLVADAEVTGTLSLFPEGSDDAMVYELSFRDDDGRAWRLRGSKRVRSRRPTVLLHDLTRLHTTLAPEDSAAGPLRRGTIRIGWPDLLRLLGSLRGVGFTRSRRLHSAARFAACFIRGALQTPPTRH